MFSNAEMLEKLFFCFLNDENLFRSTLNLLCDDNQGMKCKSWKSHMTRQEDDKQAEKDSPKLIFSTFSSSAESNPTWLFHIKS